MKRVTHTTSNWLFLALALCIAAVFLADYLTPRNVAVWVLYIVPVGLALFAWHPGVPPAVAAVASSLIIVTLFTDSAAGANTWLVTISNRCFGFASIWAVAMVGSAFIRSRLATDRQRWLQDGQTRLSERMGGDLNLAALGDRVLGFLAAHCDAVAGAMYCESSGEYRRAATYAVPANSGLPERFAPGDGLLGQAVIDRRPLVLENVPESYFQFGSGLGRGPVGRLLIAPLQIDGVVQAVIELSFLRHNGVPLIELIEQVDESIAVAVRSAKYRLRLQELLDETHRQTAELQAQGEELRVSNEELSEQSRALKESQARLEQQQAELEQTNTQLEEQAQLLAAQKDGLTASQASLRQQAEALAQASRYKSDFLANMSHELRTPLNSSLILSKLLADNRNGNLTEEQVKYANTINAAGNDLLALITDILDLSKIEAGRMEIRPETVRVQSVVEALQRTFEPVARQKNIGLTVSLSSNLPATFRTDPQRLEQVLKNLLSNALKFTDTGGVSLKVSRLGERLSFAVTDTGIGISREQQSIVFEAFRQADGTTNRKYGGTGLGLSISRELMRLLGGEIALQSTPGQGSTFTITLPIEYDQSAVAAPLPVSPAQPASTVPAPVLRPEEAGRAMRASVKIRRTEDDRETLSGDKRVILVIEDDESFARILYDLAHELGFQCLIAMTAEDGQVMAVQYLPSAVVLDMGLPDRSGLSVLDRLKRDPRTRHIPVHVVSANDYAQAAMSLGAIGYMLKPVKREALAQAFEQLESRLTQKLRRVLLVEDDAIQLESLQQLLGSHEVQTVGARTAAECLQRLQESTFDCMVLDLSLPDASGFTLLETLADGENYPFPPAIVYTGRDLTQDEEQRLGRYSKSIIIKGAKSPERLLDEVTLFLHQVVAELPPEKQKMLELSRNRDQTLEGRRILIVEDDVRNVYALTSLLEPHGIALTVARNGREALNALEAATKGKHVEIDLVLMDVMMPEMDGLTATREIRRRAEWRQLPIITLTAKAMKDDQQQCIDAGANDYLAKPLDVERLLSLVRVWMPRK